MRKEFGPHAAQLQRDMRTQSRKRGYEKTAAGGGGGRRLRPNGDGGGFSAGTASSIYSYVFSRTRGRATEDGGGDGAEAEADGGDAPSPEGTDAPSPRSDTFLSEFIPLDELLYSPDEGRLPLEALAFLRLTRTCSKGTPEADSMRHQYFLHQGVSPGRSHCAESLAAD